MTQLFNVPRREVSLAGPRLLVTDEDPEVSGLERTRPYLIPCTSPTASGSAEARVDG
jgi:hypothetical protein